MKAIAIPGVFTAILLFAAPGLFGQEIYSASEELNINIEEASDSISKLTSASKPLERTINQDLQKVRDLIRKVEANPNDLNKSEVQLAYAHAFQKVMKDADDILRYREEIEWAVEDINGELRRVGKRLDYNLSKAREKFQRQGAVVADWEKQLKEKAREIERLENRGEDTRAIKNEFSRMLRAYKNDQRALNRVEKTEAILSNTLNRFGVGGNSLDNSRLGLESFFHSLEVTRGALIQEAETNRDIAHLVNLQKGGATGLNNVISQIVGLTKLVDEFNGVTDELYDSVEGIMEIDSGDLSEVNTADTDAWKQWLEK